MTDTNKEKKEVGKVKKERSSAYPGIKLEDAIALSKILMDAYGKSPFNRDSALQALKLKAGGSSFTKVAALVHYGLMLRQGNAYSNSELAERIIYFTSEDARAAAITEAALRPKLFSSLVGEYAGRAIPSLLKNILVQQHKINRNVADSVADIFKDSMDYSGLYLNGIISAEGLPLIEETLSEDGFKQPAPIKPIGVGNSHITTHQVKVPAGMQSVTLPSGIVISYPSEIAYFFAVGKFGTQIEALEKAVNQEIKTNTNGTSTSTSE